MLRNCQNGLLKFLGGALLSVGVASSSQAFTTLPDPVADIPMANAQGTQTAVFAGGCFWGVQAVFQHVKGVKQVTSGYTGGTANTAHYEIVSSGTTGHAESVQITFDPSRVSYGKLLKVFFSIAHNPTELNFQGPDHGTQYRSAVFYTNDEQKRVAQSYIDQLQKAKTFKQTIVTQVTPLNAFYAAEAYHQDYATNHPNQPYIFINDLPKVANLQKQFPDLYF
jgi:peptide-methionine (S)-S-oxide reductase